MIDRKLINPGQRWLSSYGNVVEVISVEETIKVVYVKLGGYTKYFELGKIENYWFGSGEWKLLKNQDKADEI